MRPEAAKEGARVHFIKVTAAGSGFDLKRIDAVVVECRGAVTIVKLRNGHKRRVRTEMLKQEGRPSALDLIIDVMSGGD